jgi:hypothetical protein
LTNPDKTRRELTPKQMVAVDVIAAGATDTQAAKVVGVSRQSVNGWRRRHPYFRAELNRRREELWGASRDRLRRLIPTALTALQRELESGPDSWKAAVKVLELTGMGDNYGETGPTNPDEILDSEIRARRPDPTQRLLDNLNGHTPITDEERMRVLDELLHEAGGEGA